MTAAHATTVMRGKSYSKVGSPRRTDYIFATGEGHDGHAPKRHMLMCTSLIRQPSTQNPAIEAVAERIPQRNNE
eukprot:9288145-Alexandrium_andersonii.AAC.1